MSENKKDSKPTRGGKRPGAGRKPSTVSGIVKKLPKSSAELILAEIKANQKLVQLANSRDESIVLSTIKFLWEQAYGKAKQKLEHTGDGGGPVQAAVIVKFVDAQ